MRVIKAHFACDRCGMTREVQVDQDRAADVGLLAVLPDQPSGWRQVYGPGNRPVHLCPACGVAWSMFFKAPLNEALDAEDRAIEAEPGAMDPDRLERLRRVVGGGEEMPQ